MFVADMELPIRILSHAGRPQDDLVEWGALPLRLRLQLWLADGVFCGAQVRYNLVASLVQIPGHHHLVQLSRRSILGWTCSGRFNRPRPLIGQNRVSSVSGG